VKASSLLLSIQLGLTGWAGKATADELSGCSPGERAAIEGLCNSERGAMAQGMCRSNQITGLLRTARKPDLSVANPAQRDEIAQACASKPLIGDRFVCERNQLLSAGLPVRDEPGGGPLRTMPAANLSAQVAAPRPSAEFSYYSLEKWRLQRPAMPRAHGGPTLTPERLYKLIAPSIYVVVANTETIDVATNLPRSQGSAVAISDSILLTNCHVLAGRPQIKIVQDGNFGRARLIYADPGGDRCFLRADMPVHPVPGVSPFDDLKVGERVYSIGAKAGLERSFDEGMISGLRDLEGVRFVQNSAPTWFGSSGGGLFDAKGNLVGITTAINAKIPNESFAIAAEDFWP